MIWLNGEATDVPAGRTVADVLVLAGAPDDGRGVAVAVSGEVVPRGEWATHVVADGAHVEVLVAVQGG